MRRRDRHCKTSIPKYPHQNATLGSWGFDLLERTLIDPAGKHRDVMGYCNPSWISDYTYNGLFDRIAFVNSAAKMHLAASSKHQFVLVDGDGNLELGSSLITPPLQGGEVQQLEVVAQGGSRTAVSGRFYPLRPPPWGTPADPSARGQRGKAGVSRARIEFALGIGALLFKN